jgi:L-asparaginase
MPVESAPSVNRGEKFALAPFREVPIGVLKVFPGINFSLFDAVMTEKLKGVVLETFGAGNIPGEGNSLLPIIKRAFAAGAVVTVCSQCPQGTVALGTYAASSALVTAGAVSGYDMTTEAAVAKLYYLLAKSYTKEEIKEKMEENLRGELTR